jgi:hypothetical protein
MLYFRCCNVCILLYVSLPQSLSIRLVLAFPRWVVLLFDGDTDGLGPVGVAGEAVVPCGCVVVFVLLFKLACWAVVGEANGVETMSGAVSVHVA